MTNVINKQVGAGLSVKDIAVLGASKVLTERFSTKYIGNANMKSGAIKMAVGVGAGFFIKNKTVRFALAGMVLDGVEDLIEAGSQKIGLENKTNDMGLIV
jgi:hypothetical protein